MSAKQNSGASGVDAKTLAITAAASAGAAYVTSKVWAPGTLGAAATFPVVIALLKEALSRPTEVVTRVVPVRGVVRSSPGAGAHDEPARAPERPAERVPQAGEVAGYSRPVAGHGWKTAVVTGLLGFVIAAVIITVPEVVAGKSAGGDSQTTLFGGERSSERDDESETENETDIEPTQTDGAPASTVTVPPAQTTTVPPLTTTVPPARTTTVPPDEEQEFPPPPEPPPPP